MTRACWRRWSGCRDMSSYRTGFLRRRITIEALPIELEQTISQPYTVAFMCQEAQLKATDKVLEIGTGSGYCAAVLSLLAREVHTVERLELLYRTARARLARLRYHKVQCYLEDGTHGLPNEAPFDAIICTAGAEMLPAAYQEQLADGGRLLIPVGHHSRQQMIRMTRRGDTFSARRFGHVWLCAAGR